MLEENILRELYGQQQRSMQEIADVLRCSLHTVSYWMTKYGIPARDRSAATYAKRNPGGDPFCFNMPNTAEDIRLLGLGIGLYWGEGNKANKNSIRLGNTDPELIRYFIDFLVKIFRIDPHKLKFGLQVFSDININEALDFWAKKLNIHMDQIGKPVVTRSGKIGNYRKKNQYGVLTVMYHNKKLRDLIISLLPM